MKNYIPFNKPVYFEESLKLIESTVKSQSTINIAGDGENCKKCESILSEILDAPTLLTTSCTHALEMTALLFDIKENDEVIAPSYTFVSTVLAYRLRGAKIKFVEVDPKTGNMDLDHLGQIISEKTKVVITVHYAGNSTDMDQLTSICKNYNTYLVEDAAQSLGSTYKGKALGTFGDLATISFHETKNVTSGEGGALIVNNPKFFERAKIIREKGTNRSQFKEGLVDKYSWVDIGSSYIISDLNAAYLLPQLKNLDKINTKRLKVFNKYLNNIKPGKDRYILETPAYNEPNGHLFAIILKNNTERNKFISYMKKQGIITPFHYVALHSTPYVRQINKHIENLPNTDILSERLVRLPLFYEITSQEVKHVIKYVNKFFDEN
ncbi:dTDP-4-amino-4,6-dideoxygalactose transaminase [Candidatus Dojkabacteria bacterium]|nr:dTDP-4-amino-4,6-dideoxygalactose transaminase [Candidatus Dojkabacteria bacterium]